MAFTDFRPAPEADTFKCAERHQQSAFFPEPNHFASNHAIIASDDVAAITDGQVPLHAGDFHQQTLHRRDTAVHTMHRQPVELVYER